MKNGFTLIESMIALSITASIAGVTINEVSDHNKDIYGKKIALDINNILNAVNNRIAIDGYDPDLWINTSWADRHIIRNELIKKELNTINSICPNGKWNPIGTSNDDITLLNCDLYKNESNIDINLSAEITTDTLDFINGFNIYFSFNNENDFKSYYQGLKRGIREISMSNQKEISGTHTYYFVESSNRNNIISTNQCISNPLNCEFKASYSRIGGGEYIRADGSNSIIGENLTFIETKSSDAPLKCLRWKNNIDRDRYNTGIWKVEEDDCGVGIYKTKNNKNEIALIADTGTFKNILLDKSCNRYSWNGSDVLTVSTANPTPCGTTSDGSYIYQVVDNTEATQGLFKHLRASEIGAKEILTKDLIAENITVDVIKSLNELNFESVANFKKLVNFDENVVFDKELKIESTGKFINKGYTDLEHVTINKNLNVAGAVSINGKTDINNILSAHHLDIKYDANIEGKIDANSVTANIGKFNNIDNDMNSMKREIQRLRSELNKVKPIPAPITSVWKKIRVYKKSDTGCKYSRPSCSVSNTSSVSSGKACGSIGLRTNVTSNYTSRQWRSGGETCRSCSVTVTEMLCTNK